MCMGTLYEMRLKPAFLTYISALHMSFYKLCVLHLVPKCPAHVRQRNAECCSAVVNIHTEVSHLHQSD